jgi:hypothetical protein
MGCNILNDPEIICPERIEFLIIAGHIHDNIRKELQSLICRLGLDSFVSKKDILIQCREYVEMVHNFPLRAVIFRLILME